MPDDTVEWTDAQREELRRLLAPQMLHWNGPLEIDPNGGYRPAPCRSGGMVYALKDVAREFGIDLDGDDAG